MKENIFFERILEQAMNSGKSINQIERELNYPRNSLNNYRLGSEPSGKRLIEMSHYFGVSPEYLMGYIKNNEETPKISLLFKTLTSRERLELYIACKNWLLSSNDTIII